MVMKAPSTQLQAASHRAQLTWGDACVEVAERGSSFQIHDAGEDGRR